MVNNMILILNCDFDENTQTNGAQLIASHLRKKGLESEIKNVFENEFPDDIKKTGRIIITGSRAAVYDDREWIANLSDILKRILKKKTRKRFFAIWALALTLFMR